MICGTVIKHVNVVVVVGPVVSAMINYWDIRKVTMAGGFVAASAFALSTLSPRISILILMYGVLGGE